MDEQNTRIRIYVAIKQLSRASKKVKEHPFVLERKPRTFRELIEESVKSCIRAYEQRGSSGENPEPLTDEQWEAMVELGKLTFGVHYNDSKVDEAKAVETALDAVRDGQVRVFRGTQELLELDTPLEISEGEVFTFMKLTMLSGRLW